jgi:hypothetical protein
MPYKIVGNKVMHKKGGRWSVKQTCKSHANAIKALGLLEGLEKGTITPAQVKARRMRKHGK